MCDVETAPSREALLADLATLAEDFGRLFATDAECHCRTDRDYWPRRSAERYRVAPSVGGRDADWDRVEWGNGLEVSPVPVRTAEDAERAPILFDASGCPVVNSAGQSMILAPGWGSSHYVRLRGPGSIRAGETIERANQWAAESVPLWAPLLFPGRGLTVRAWCWPDLVSAVAEAAGRATLRPDRWMVAAGGQSFSLILWRRRAEYTLGGPMVTSELAEAIGPEPDSVWAERRAFLRDSESAARWLIEALAKAPESAGGDEIPEGAPDCSFDGGSRVLLWHGKTYPLTPNMAEVVAVLFAAWERGRPEVSLAEIENRTTSESMGESLFKVFQRRKDGRKYTDPVWGEIERVGQGVYRLADPKT